MSRRDLTPIGKITVIKSLALPKLIHLFSALPNPPKYILSELEKIFFKFIWNNKPDKIKRKTLISSYEKGGLNMIHLPSFIDYIKIKWLKRIHENPNGLWQKLLSLIIGIKTDAEGVWWLSRNKLLELKKNVKNCFWKDVIESVIKVKKEQLSVSEYIQEDIRNFCSLSEYDFYTKWRENGVSCLNDLQKNDGKFKSFLEAY